MSLAVCHQGEEEGRCGRTQFLTEKSQCPTFSEEIASVAERAKHLSLALICVLFLKKRELKINTRRRVVRETRDTMSKDKWKRKVTGSTGEAFLDLRVGVLLWP